MSLFQCFIPTAGKDQDRMAKVNVADPDWRPDSIGVSGFGSEFLTRILSLYVELKYFPRAWKVFMEWRP